MAGKCAEPELGSVIRMFKPFLTLDVEGLRSGRGLCSAGGLYSVGGLYPVDLLYSLGVLCCVTVSELYSACVL